MVILCTLIPTLGMFVYCNKHISGDSVTYIILYCCFILLLFYIVWLFFNSIVLYSSHHTDRLVVLHAILIVRRKLGPGGKVVYTFFDD